MPCDCFNGGSCVNARFADKNHEEIEYECRCPAGFTGLRCERERDECTPNPCEHGTCVDLPTGFRCLCDHGFEGDRCNKMKDFCAEQPCFPNVSCSSETGGFRCGPCPPGYTGNGIRCVGLSPCTERPCFPGVVCSNLPSSRLGYVCGPCPKYFSGDGKRCTRDAIPACRDGVCSEVSRCMEIQEPPGYKCGPCPARYKGDGRTCTRESFRTSVSQRESKEY
ncbi:protein jagged-1a-like [Aplysia californica]|uniref:Protein jagged-1a-like n=1 Tax=Aplysia californica TaxID=6500 RepID=A0ABM1W347_APLCA|nr:protein jagged-1a-like [Aplysia californica]